MPNRKKKASRWAEAVAAAVLVVAAAAACADDAPPQASLSVTPAAPADLLPIGVAPQQTFVVDGKRSNCRDLPQLLAGKTQKNFVVSGVEGSPVRVSDIICVARIAKERGGQTFVADADGTLRTATLDAD